jgi:hypothetical protein
MARAISDRRRVRACRHGSVALAQGDASVQRGALTDGYAGLSQKGLPLRRALSCRAGVHGRHVDATAIVVVSILMAAALLQMPYSIPVADAQLASLAGAALLRVFAVAMGGPHQSVGSPPAGAGGQLGADRGQLRITSTCPVTALVVAYSRSEALWV